VARTGRRARGVLAATSFLVIACLAALAASNRPRDATAAVAAVGLLAGACAVYLVWRAEPAWTLMWALVLSPITGHWTEFGIPGALSPQRLLLLGAVATVLLRGPAVRDRPRLPTSAVHYLLVLAGLYAVGSAAAAGTLEQKDAVFSLLEAYGVLLFAVFYVAPVMFATRRSRELLLVVLVGLGLYLGCTALFETIHLSGLVFPSYINDPGVGIHYGRARGPFTEAVLNGVALFLCGGAALLALVLWHRRWSRCIAAAVCALCAAGLLFTLQRSVWLAALVAVIVTGLVTPPLRRYLLPGLATLALVAAGAYLVVGGDTVAQRAGDRATVWDRENLNDAALNMIDARPLFGFGWSEFQTASVQGSFFQQADDHPLTAAGLVVHNEFLSHGAELGLVGLSLWLASMGAACVWALRSPAPTPDLRLWKVAFLAYALFYLVVSNAVPPYFFPNLVFWLLAGVVAAGRVPAER
jgi:putative inorganic carbon (hco3(-)) transporter